MEGTDKGMNERSSENPTGIAYKPSASEDGANELGRSFQSWMDGGDADEQRETLEYLIQALDEDRLSDRELFPKKLKGKSW